MTSGSQVADKYASTKKRVRALAHRVQCELEQVIEDSTRAQGQNPQRPPVPIFFTRAFNALKSELVTINHNDIFLHAMQHMARCSLLSEFGPAQDGNDFPECLESGFLKIEDQPLMSEVRNFMKDVVVYIRNSHVSTGQLPLLPFSYHITLGGYRKMAEESNFGFKEVVDSIPDIIQNTIQGVLGNGIVGDNYLDQSNLQYNDFVDSFNVSNLI